jgi:hypothetical protein
LESAIRLFSTALVPSLQILPLPRTTRENLASAPSSDRPDLFFSHFLGRFFGRRVQASASAGQQSAGIRRSSPLPAAFLRSLLRAFRQPAQLLRPRSHFFRRDAFAFRSSTPSSGSITSPERQPPFPALRNKRRRTGESSPPFSRRCREFPPAARASCPPAFL